MILHWILLIVAFATNSADGTNDTPINAAVAAPSAEASPEQPAADASNGLVAEDQTPTGQFTTAGEIKPIMMATKPSWVALRDYNGQDLLYVTHLWAWRCGLLQVEYAINGGAYEVWPLPACHIGTAQPNAITEADGLPYKGFAKGLVTDVKVRITYDDLTTDEASYPRPSILLP